MNSLTGGKGEDSCHDPGIIYFNLIQYSETSWLRYGRGRIRDRPLVSTRSGKGVFKSQADSWNARVNRDTKTPEIVEDDKGWGEIMYVLRGSFFNEI